MNLKLRILLMIVVCALILAHQSWRLISGVLALIVFLAHAELAGSARDE